MPTFEELFNISNIQDVNSPNTNNGFVDLEYGFPEEYRESKLNTSNLNNHYFDTKFLISFNRLMKNILIQRKDYFFRYQDYIIIPNSPENVYQSKNGKIKSIFTIGNTKIGDVTTKKFQNRVLINTQSKSISFLMLFMYENVHRIKRSTDEEKYAFKIYFSDYKNYKATILEIGHYESDYHKNRILKEFIKHFNLNKNNLNNITWLYEKAPPYIIEERELLQIKNDLISILSVNITEGKSFFGSGINKEVAVLNLLKGLLLKIKNPDTFLAYLLKPFSNQTILQRLFYKIDNKFGGANFTKLVQFLYGVWKTSDFSNYENNEYNKTDGVSSLPYKSNKFLGFYYSNTNLKFNNKIINVAIETGEYEYIYEYNFYAKAKVLKKKEIILNYKYHPFQPILLTEMVENSNLKLAGKVPAFFLLANDDIAYWSNVLTTVEYGVDILTTFSGVANITKFRHLAKLTNTASKFQKFQKVAKYTNTIAKIKLAAGTIEIASGTVNVLIKLSGADSKFAKALQKYLFYLELATLAGELKGVVKQKIRNNIKKHAKDALSKKEDIVKLQKNAKNLEEVKEVDDALEHLDQVSKSQKIRNNLLANVPTVKNNAFNNWFDELSIKEFNIVWKDLKKRKLIKSRIRHPGGLHEWLMVSRTDVFKKWGVSIKQIKKLRTKIENVVFKNPPGSHGGLGSTKAHNEILKLIDESKNYIEFKNKLLNWASNRMVGGIDALPKGLKN